MRNEIKKIRLDLTKDCLLKETRFKTKQSEKKEKIENNKKEVGK